MQYVDRREKTLSDWPHVLITVVVCLLCWIACYFFSTGFPLTGNDAFMPFGGDMNKWLNNKTVIYASGLLLMILTAFIIQRINDIEMLISERTRLVFLFYILLTSTNLRIIPFNNGTIVLLCLVCMINELFKTFQSPEDKGKLFNAGVCIGVASLFVPQTLWFVLLLWLGMYQLFSLNYRSFFSSLIGVLSIFWFVLTWSVWKHDFSIFRNVYISLTDIKLFAVFHSMRYYHIGFIFIAVMMIPLMLNIKMDTINNRMRVRQMLSFLLNMSVMSCILIFLYGRNANVFISVLYLPLSVLLAYFFENMRKRFYFIFYYFILALCFSSFIVRLWNYSLNTVT